MFVYDLDMERNKIKLYLFIISKYILFVHLNPYRSGPYSHLNRSGGGHIDPPSISAPGTDKDVKFFSGGSCVFLEKITFSSHSDQAAP